VLHENILYIRDENAIGDVYHKLKLSFAMPRVTVREIIAERVRIEVDAYNSKTHEYMHTLVKPSEAEETLNGYKLHDKRKVNPEKQVEVALQAFSSNGFFMLVGEQQAEDLDMPVDITNDLVISFVKLTPLVGG